MKDYLCKCNNCGAIMFDERPQTGAKQFDAPQTTIEMEHLSDVEGDGDFWGCPNCGTDAYLMDIESETELNNAAK